MRDHQRNALGVLLALAIAASAAPAAAHPERTTTYPDPQTGSVPSYRTVGPRLVVCRPDSARRVARIFHGQARRLSEARRTLRRCRFENIQAAVDAASSGSRIVVMPGVYKEEPSRAKPFDDPRCRDDFEVPADGDAPVPTYEHHVKCPNSWNLIAVIGVHDLQIEGAGRRPEDVLIVGDRIRRDVIRADRADGVVIRNLAVEQAAFNGIDVAETNGFRLERIVARWNQAYGILSFTSDHGLYDDIRAFGNGDAGVYPGSGPEGHCRRFGIEVRNVDSYGNLAGYSGTAGNGTWVHDSRFHGNVVGITMDSVVPGHPGMPQDCSLFEDNEIHSNNLNLYGDERAKTCTERPFEERERTLVCPQFLQPVGTGMSLFGVNANVIRRNRIWNNWRAGIRLYWSPAMLRGENDPLKQYDTSHDNHIEDNTVGVGPGGEADPNGVDFFWDEEGSGNCWSGNAGFGGAAPTSDPKHLPACPDGAPFSIGNPLIGPTLVPCTTWDPAENNHPAGCDFWETPPEPQPARRSAQRLAWVQPPSVLSVHGDTVLNGVVRNAGSSTITLDADGVRVIGGSARAPNARFAPSWGHSLYGAFGGPKDMGISERRRLGIITTLAPDETSQLTVAWKGGLGSTVAFGQVRLPVAPSNARQEG